MPTPAPTAAATLRLIRWGSWASIVRLGLSAQKTLPLNCTAVGRRCQPHIEPVCGQSFWQQAIGLLFNSFHFLFSLAQAFTPVEPETIIDVSFSFSSL
jgi:hypothetical protein